MHEESVGVSGVWRVEVYDYFRGGCGNRVSSIRRGETFILGMGGGGGFGWWKWGMVL